MNAHPNLGMQVTTFENPMGIDGFEFVEFAAPAGQGESMRRYFRDMGFTATMRHKSRPITLFRQGGVNFLLNESEDSFAADFARARFERVRLRDRFQEAGARRARYRARQRRRKNHRQARHESGRRARHQGHRRLHALSRRSQPR
jgi:4-hydroxyphenylpyruvate dioxygenase-like putative hemolysin